MKNKKCIKKTLPINADSTKVFSVIADVENWNLWTKSITSIAFLNNNKFEIGGQARVTQPKLSPALWTITAIIKNSSFTWQTKTFGVTMTAKHTATATAKGTLAEIEMTYDGWLASLIYKLSKNLTDHYLTMEINGLKNECEKLE
jgi:hypothetical protein